MLANTNLGSLQRCNICEMQGKSAGRRGPVDRIRGTQVYPCYAAAFSYMNAKPRTKKFSMQYKLHINKVGIERWNNFAILAKKDMCRLLNSWKQYIPFTYHFEDTDSEYIVVMNTMGTALQNKALLMLSRGLWEYPHNVCAYDALKLRDEGTLEGVDSLSLVQLYILCLTSCRYFSSSESLISTKHAAFLSGVQFRDALKVTGRKQISSIFLPYRARYQPIRWNKDLQYHEIMDDFATRRSIYSANINSFCHAQ